MGERTFSLDVVGVQTPCHERWDAMTGDAQKRFCDQCEKHVHNLSAMTRDQAQALVNANPTGLCIRMVKDAHGRVITADSQPMEQSRRRAAFGRLPWLGVLAGVASAVLIWFGITRPPAEPQCTMGVEAPPPPQAQPAPARQPPVIHQGGICPPNVKPIPVEVLLGDIVIQQPEHLQPLMGLIMQTPPEPPVKELIDQLQQEQQPPRPPEQAPLLGRLKTPKGPSLEEFMQQNPQAEQPSPRPPA